MLPTEVFWYHFAITKGTLPFSAMPWSYVSTWGTQDFLIMPWACSCLQCDRQVVVCFESVRFAMAVNVTVTPEQAALLLPILQQVTSGTLAPAVLPPGQGDGSSTSSQSPSPSFVPPTRQLMWRHLSSPPTSESDTSESSGNYTRYQLLHRKKNTASSEAQTYLEVSSSS